MYETSFLSTYHMFKINVTRNKNNCFIMVLYLRRIPLLGTTPYSESSHTLFGYILFQVDTWQHFNWLFSSGAGNWCRKQRQNTISLGLNAVVCKRDSHKTTIGARKDTPFVAKCGVLCRH